MIEAIVDHAQPLDAAATVIKVCLSADWQYSKCHTAPLEDAAEITASLFIRGSLAILESLAHVISSRIISE